MRIVKSQHDFEIAISGLVPDGATAYVVQHCKFSDEEHIFLNIHGNRVGGCLIAADHYGRQVGVAIYQVQNKQISYAEIAVCKEFMEGGSHSRDGMNEVVIISNLTQSLINLYTALAIETAAS